jgi:hypothetical protein
MQRHEMTEASAKAILNQALVVREMNNGEVTSRDPRLTQALSVVGITVLQSVDFGVECYLRLIEKPEKFKQGGF